MKQNLVFTRVFDFRSQGTWSAWVEAEMVKRWWGPDRFTCSVAKMGVRVGTPRWYACASLRSWGGQDAYNLWEYEAVEPMKRLVYDWPIGRMMELSRTGMEQCLDEMAKALERLMSKKILKSISAILAGQSVASLCRARNSRDGDRARRSLAAIPSAVVFEYVSHGHATGLRRNGREGIVVSGSLVNSSAVMTLLLIPSTVIWSYFVGGVVLAIGLATIFLRGDWKKARGFDKLILFGPLFYAAPIAAFGTEHFTVTDAIASVMPAWIPWHQLWVYFVGACFIAAALSLVTRVQARLSASLLGLTFFLFVVLMHAPGWAQNPRNRFALAVALREISFSGGALALAASLTGQWGERGTHILATIARYFVAIPVLFYSFEQFLHGDHVPGIPLKPVTPEYVYGHAIWTYLAAVVYAVAGTLLLVSTKTRAAATWLGLTVLFVELVVYVPIGVVERASLANGLNYVADTLMFCGAVLLLAGAMPREV